MDLEDLADGLVGLKSVKEVVTKKIDSKKRHVIEVNIAEDYQDGKGVEALNEISKYVAKQKKVINSLSYSEGSVSIIYSDVKKGSSKRSPGCGGSMIPTYKPR